MIRTRLRYKVQKALRALGVSAREIHIEHPADPAYGDYATNAALVYAKEAGEKPVSFAEKLVEALAKDDDTAVEKVEAAGPGFINFHLSLSFFEESVQETVRAGEAYGKGDASSGIRAMVEYTDPNPFKEFHIGHLLPNAIGESLSRIIAFSGAEVGRANYQGDVGLHVAKAVWGLQRAGSGKVDVSTLGKAYAEGSAAYEKDEASRGAIEDINKKIYEAGDEELMKLYEEGKRVSLQYFETVYRKLGTKFDFYFFESGTAPLGAQIVRERIGTVFEESNGAVIFRGEKYGLHTRVFITKDGLPTYEAKELGLAVKKQEVFPHDLSLIVTGSEVKEYFAVFLKVLELVDRKLAEKTRHIHHGMLRLKSGKMSSRAGNVIPVESLIRKSAEIVLQKIRENKEIEGREQERLAEKVAVGAIKYSILKNAIGHDVVFDFETSLAFEGNSGPYLQYTHTRARSVLRRAAGCGAAASNAAGTFDDAAGAAASRGENGGDIAARSVERVLYRFQEVVLRAQKEYAPHHVATFLFELAQAFNAFYAKERIIEAGARTPHRLLLVEAVATTLQNGLYLLGIEAPERM